MFLGTKSVKKVKHCLWMDQQSVVFGCETSQFQNCQNLFDEIRSQKIWYQRSFGFGLENIR